MYFLLFFLFALTGLDANPTPSPGPVCPPSSWVYDEGIYNVDLTIGDPIVVPITIGGPFALQPTDIYFLWDTSAYSREYSFHYWIGGSRRLRRVMNDTIQANPGTKFGLGFFRTKRLHNIGVGSDYVFEHAADITSDIVYVQKRFNNSEWSLVAAVSPINSAIEAAQHVMLNATAFGFRPNARKIIFLATSTMFGQQGDTKTRTTWTVAPLMQLDPGSNVPFLFPRPNDGDVVLEDDCTIMGAVCYESVVGAVTPCFAQTSVAVSAPPTPLLSTTNIVCSCPYATGNLTKLNITQFARGSCEDFPSQAQIPVAAAGGFDLFAFLPADRLDQGIVPIYTALVNSISNNGAVISGTLELSTELPPLVPQVPDPLQFTVTWNVPEVQNYTIGPCDMDFCTFNFLFVGSIPGQSTQLADIFIDGNPFTFNVETCGPTQSYTQTPTYSRSQSSSNSQSNSPSESQSQSSSSSQSSTQSFSQSQSRSGTNVRTQSSSQSQSSTMSGSRSQTQSASASSSQSSTNGNTQSASQSASSSQSSTNGNTQSASQSASRSQSTNGNTQSASQSASRSQSLSDAETQSSSNTQSASQSASSSQSLSNAQTQSFSQSSSDSSSNTGTPTNSYSQSLSISNSGTTSQSRSNGITQSYSRSQSQSASESTGITQSQSESESTSQTGPIPTESPTGTPSESPSVFVPTNSPSPGINTTQSRSAAMSKTPAPMVGEPPSLGWIIGLSTAIGVLIPCCFCCVLLWGRRRRRRRRPDANEYED